MYASESLNRIVHFKTLSKFNVSLRLDLCLNCQVLSEVFSVASVFKHKLEKVRETLAGHLKSAAGGGSDNTAQ